MEPLNSFRVVRTSKLNKQIGGPIAGAGDYRIWNFARSPCLGNHPLTFPQRCQVWPLGQVQEVDGGCSQIMRELKTLTDPTGLLTREGLSRLAGCT